MVIGLVLVVLGSLPWQFPFSRSSPKSAWRTLGSSQSTFQAAPIVFNPIVGGIALTAGIVLVAGGASFRVRFSSPRSWAVLVLCQLNLSTKPSKIFSDQVA